MKPIQHILHKAITQPFYRQHAGAFLFSFFILFGIQPSAADALQFHYSIILSILNSAAFFLAAFTIWMIYTLKTILFIRECLKKESYDFVYLLYGIERKRSLRNLSAMLGMMMAPLFVYGFVVILIAGIRNRWLAGAAVLFSLLLLFMVSLLMVWKLIGKGKDNQLMRKRSSLFSLKPGLFSILLKFIFNKQFITLFILKTVSFTALYFFSKTDSEFFEGRMLWLLFITVLVGHGVIIFRNFQFMENELYFYRNMPVSLWYTLLSLLGIYAVLLIPECWALKGMIFIQHNIQEYCWLLLTGPAVLLLIHSLLYSEDIRVNDFIYLLFGIWVVFIFFSLSDMRWLMPVIGCVSGAVIFRISYYRFEKKADTELTISGKQD